MRKQKYRFIYAVLPVIFVFVAVSLHAQDGGINNEVVSYKKRELNSGVVFEMNKEREELLTDDSKYQEERTIFNGKYRFENRFWNLLDYKQEYFNTSFEVGAFGASGDWIDSSFVKSNTADYTSYGFRTSANISYLNRYYYDTKNYTLVDVSAWGRYDLYKQSSDGTIIDSFGVASNLDNNVTEDRLRFGFSAKAGWGLGRLSPMNYLMTADYLLRKYYPGRNFSDYEIAQFAQAIATIKHEREIKTGHVNEKEMELIADFLKNTLLLASSDAIGAEWRFSEFDPRYQGQRLEFGPHFTYYNQEPDFVYGGYIKYENSKYQNVRWNRNFSAGIKYDRYKKQDWMYGEVDFGWTYYFELKSQLDFGVKYAPGIEINGFEDVGSLSHNVIPYLSYFTQLNSKSRVKFDFAWRFADSQQFVLPGPEFSLAIYRSKY